MQDSPRAVRVLEPFSFWPNFASALQARGGVAEGPDPFYCFHTPYVEFSPGTVIYRVKLIGARATSGELMLRVHGYRSDGTMDALLVGGARVALADIDGDYEYTVRAAAIPGVLYAFYGRFSEPSDLTISELKLESEELADEDADAYVTDDIGNSEFAATELVDDHHLQGDGKPSLRIPLSQPCTAAQIDEIDWGEIAQATAPPDDPFDRWRIAFALRALATYGPNRSGAAGIVRSPARLPLADLLQSRGCFISNNDAEQPAGRYDFFVTVVDPTEANVQAGVEQQVLDLSRMLLRKGVGIAIFDIATDVAAVIRSSEEGAPYVSTLQDAQRIALRVIGHGGEVAQFLFPHSLQDDGLPALRPFGLVIRR